MRSPEQCPGCQSNAIQALVPHQQAPAHAHAGIQQQVPALAAPTSTSHINASQELVFNQQALGHANQYTHQQAPALAAPASTSHINAGQALVFNQQAQGYAHVGFKHQSPNPPPAASASGYNTTTGGSSDMMKYRGNSPEGETTLQKASRIGQILMAEQKQKTAKEMTEAGYDVATYGIRPLTKVKSKFELPSLPTSEESLLTPEKTDAQSSPSPLPTRPLEEPGLVPTSLTRHPLLQLRALRRPWRRRLRRPPTLWIQVDSSPWPRRSRKTSSSSLLVMRALSKSSTSSTRRSFGSCRVFESCRRLFSLAVLK